MSLSSNWRSPLKVFVSSTAWELGQNKGCFFHLNKAPIKQQPAH